MNPDNGLTGGMGIGSMPDASGLGTPTDGAVPAPVDFTADTAGAGGLSMADSLASAQDDLTSAGMAARQQDPNSIGLDQISAADPAAMMARPDEPLVPAAPVPGSIGSAVSGGATPVTNPAAAAAPTDAGMGGMTAMPDATQAAPATPVSAADAMSAALAEPAPGATDNMPMGQDAGPAANNPFLNNTTNVPAEGAMMNPVASALPTSGSMGMAAEAPAQAPYNPFASLATTSSNNVPAGLQPKTEKFSEAGAGAGKKPSHMMSILLGGLAVLFAVAAVIFFILWQQEAKNEKIVYLPAEGDSGTQVDARETLFVCTRQSAGDETTASMEGMIYGEDSARLTFTDGVISGFTEGGALTFGDEMQAANAIAQAQMVVGLMATMYGGDAGEGVVQSGNVLSYSVAIDLNAFAASTAMEGEGSMSATIGALRAENGAIANGAQGVLIADYQAQGYGCVEQ